jgi:hypothetical protein
MTSNTRYDVGDHVTVEGETGRFEVTNIQNAASDSPDYILNGGLVAKASGMKKVQQEDWREKAKNELENKLEVDTERMTYKFYEDMYGVDVFALESVSGKANNGEREWVVFKTHKDAVKAAEEKVERDLKDQPQLFEDNFLRDHLYIGNTDKRMIASDDARARTRNRDKDELLRMARERGADVDEDDDIDTIREEVRMTLKEEFEAQMEQDLEQYFRPLYGDDWTDQDFIRIDVEEAAEDAVATDGAGHFLDVYDFEPVNLEHGVAYAVN